MNGKAARSNTMILQLSVGKRKLVTMNRKIFIKKGLMGTGLFIMSSVSGNVINNNIDELRQLEILGFNYLPNTKIKYGKLYFS